MPRFRRWLRWLRWLLALFVALALAGAIAAGALYYVVSSKLPDVQALREVELQEPMYVHASDGKLMAVFGETRRYPIEMKDVPERLKQAFLATEDARFYEHG
ncbi:MAG: transglycosylase domain-containing protein, partial [Stenotrophomonas nitritireducens]|nr:transglycosylase domain-containing protein [Stenotrophomonas nitritireducens]